MKTRVQKWGNSLAIRIPKAFASLTGLAEDVEVNLELEKGKLVIRPQVHTPPTLEELLRKVTPQNLHGEWDTGAPMGNEIW